MNKLVKWILPNVLFLQSSHSLCLNINAVKFWYLQILALWGGVCTVSCLAPSWPHGRWSACVWLKHNSSTPLAQTGGLHKAAIVWGSRCPSCHANSICHREQMGGEEQALGGEKKREEGGWLNAELTFEFAAALCTICICLYHVQGRLHSFFKWKLAWTR